MFLFSMSWENWVSTPYRSFYQNSYTTEFEKEFEFWSFLFSNAVNLTNFVLLCFYWLYYVLHFPWDPNLCFTRDRRLICRREGPEGFCGVMKYFRHILMGHEIFFKIFDGPQNIFLCSIFVILFFNLRALEHKISKLAIKEI